MKTPIQLLLVFTSINVLVSSTPGITPEEQECLDDKKVWQRKTRACKTCKPCSYGAGRNFTHTTNIRRKGSGDMRCPPCTTCPKGFYNMRKDAVTCARCVKNCTSNHRNVQSECTNLQDNTCGACLPGHYDKYQNVDFPCFKLETVTPEPYKHTARSNNYKVGGEHNKNKTEHVEIPLPVSEPLETKPVFVGAVVGGIFIIAILVGIVLLLVVMARKKKRHRNKERGSSFAPHSSEKLILSEDNDIEIDNPDIQRQKNVGRRVANYSRQDSDDGKAKLRVHPTSLVSFERSPNVRAEMAISLPTSGPSAINPFQGLEKIGKKCECVKRPSCNCCISINTGPQRILVRSSPVFDIVARFVCHDPTSLFKGLGIHDSDIYQINDDRDRDPQRISESDTVFRLLQIWVERRPKDASLRKLCNELCTAGFHSITWKLVTNPPV